MSKYILTEKTIKNAWEDELGINELHELACIGAGDARRYDDTNKINLVDVKKKQIYAYTVLASWLHIIENPAIFTTLSVKMFDEMVKYDVVGQLERAEFADIETRSKARHLYRAYSIFVDMLNDETNSLVALLNYSEQCKA